MPVLTGSASSDIDASIDRCWALIEDVAAAPRWQNNLVSIDVIERDDRGRAVIADAVTDAKFAKVRTRQKFSYDGPTRMSWTMIEGELDSMEGSWELRDLGGGRTRATYSLAVDPGPIGRALVGPLERIARRMVVNGRAKELGKAVTAAG